MMYCADVRSVVCDLCDSVALQLHPDKNKHPKAELAFKLVSEVIYSLRMRIG